MQDFDLNEGFQLSEQSWFFMHENLLKKNTIASPLQKNDAEAVLVRHGCLFIGYDHEKG
jgi:hypothetical protein